MKTTRFDGSDIRRILTAMVMDQTVCSRISAQWADGGLFESRWANLIGGWCVKHMKLYQRPPRERITRIFEKWADSGKADDKTVSAVESFLSHLSSEYGQQEEGDESQYVLDIAGEHFNKLRLKEVFEEGLLDIQEDKLDQAEERLSKLTKVELGVGSFVKPAEDFSIWEQAFSRERTRPLVTYPGAAGRYFDGSFLRSEFYSFLAPDKTGKTSYLIDFAYRAIRRKNTVAYFECGDGDQDEVLTRLGVRLTGQPEFSGTLTFPLGWDDKNTLMTIDRHREKVSEIDAFREVRRVTRQDDAFRLSCHVSSSISVEGIDSIMSEWDRSGWRPDVVVIDYADILAPPSGNRDKLEQIEETWKQLRRLSQKRHCLVVTATQANAGSYKKGPKDFLTKDNFSGSKSKNAHVNGMIGINASDPEMAIQSGRLRWVARRKQKHQSKQSFVRVAGNFDVGNPIIVSNFDNFEK